MTRDASTGISGHHRARSYMPRHGAPEYHLRMSDKYSGAVEFWINQYTTADDWLGFYGDFCMVFLDRIPEYQTIKRANFVPPQAMVHIRADGTKHDDWVDLGYGRGLHVRYDPNYSEPGRLYELAAYSHEALLKLDAFLGGFSHWLQENW